MSLKGIADEMDGSYWEKNCREVLRKGKAKRTGELPAVPRPTGRGDYRDPKSVEFGHRPEFTMERTRPTLPRYASPLKALKLTCITLSIILRISKSAENPGAPIDPVVLRPRHGGRIQQGALQGRAANVPRAVVGCCQEKTRPAERRGQPGITPDPAGEQVGIPAGGSKGAVQHTDQRPVSRVFPMGR